MLAIVAAPPTRAVAIGLPTIRRCTTRQGSPPHSQRHRAMKHHVPESDSETPPHCGRSRLFAIRPVVAQQQASEAFHLSTQFVDPAGRADAVRDANELIQRAIEPLGVAGQPVAEECE
jgi:hypothetical protein